MSLWLGRILAKYESKYEISVITTSSSHIVQLM